MFNLKFILSITIFISLLIVTSFIKNQSRIIEKKILKINSQVISKEKNLSETELDFFYLTSPSEIEKKVEKNNLDNFQPIEHSKIFTNIVDFTNIEKKLSRLKNSNEKKIKKK